MNIVFNHSPKNVARRLSRAAKKEFPGALAGFSYTKIYDDGARETQYAHAVFHEDRCGYWKYPYSVAIERQGCLASSNGECNQFGCVHPEDPFWVFATSVANELYSLEFKRHGCREIAKDGPERFQDWCEATGMKPWA